MVDYSAAVLEDSIAVGFKGGPEWVTSRVGAISGYRVNNQQRDTPVHRYRFSSAETGITTLRTLKAFHMGVRGGAKSWLLKDWADYSVTGESLGNVDGATTSFPIKKTYSSFNGYARTNLYIKTSTLKVYIDGVLQTINTDFTVTDAGNGICQGPIVFGSPAPTESPGALTWDGEFYVPVTFDQDICEIEITARTGEYGRIPRLDCTEELPTA